MNTHAQKILVAGRIPGKLLTVRLATLFLLIMCSYNARATVITWIRAGGGNWSVATNWSPNLVPGPGDDVYITNYAPTVAVDFSTSVASLAFSGGNLGGASSLTVNGPFTWSGGSINNTGGVRLNGTSSLNAAVGNHMELVYGLLINAGRLTWSGSGTNLVLYDSTFTNLASGTVTIAGDVSDTIANTATFGNAGSVIKNGTPGTATLHAIFVNTGTVQVQSGTFNLAGSHALNGGTLEFGISGATNYGKINLSGAALFMGSLNVNLNGFYWPAVGSSFNLLTYASEAGVLFTNTSLPSFITWRTNYNPTTFTLSVVARQTNAAPTNLTVSLAGNTNLNLAWPGDHTGWQLEAQTNSLPGTNWVIVPGSGLTNEMTFPIGLANGTVFFRLMYP
jgi:hypothetical protein